MALVFMWICLTSVLLSGSYAQICAPCHQDATCRAGTCICNAGFTGNGMDCQDNDPPVFTANSCPSDRTKVADPRSMETMVTWSDPTATDSTNVAPTVQCTPASGTDFTIGQTPVTCTATDAAGNMATPDCTFTVTVEDFNECTATNSDRHTCDESISVCMNTDGDYNCNCNAGYSNNNGDGKTCEDIYECQPSPCTNAQCTNTAGSFTCTCNAGYSQSSGDATMCIDDPPVFDTQCPADINRFADPRSTTTTVTWTDPMASDVVDGGSVNVVCNPPSGRDLQIGTHRVTCTATDSAGNTRDCSFDVIITDFNECTASVGSPGRHDCVNAECSNEDGGFSCTCNNGYSKPNMDDHTCSDTTPPVFDPNTCRSPDAQVADPESMTSTSVTWTTPTATDTTGIAPTVTCTPSTNHAFRIGDTDVTCIARDAAGNMALINCAFTVTVIDFDECSAVMNRDNCDTFANCTNIDGGFLCTCTAGYTGSGVTCTECADGFFGLGCLSRCTCIQGADCNNVNGACTCTPGFTNAVCDKDYLDVELSVTEEPVLDTAAVDNASLRCQVNLPSGDLDPANPVIITNPDGTSETASMIMEGLYEIIVHDISPAISGKYTCTATTVINGVGLSDSDEFELDVLGPGRIISLNESTEGKLGETATVYCVVNARPRPVITWYDKNNAVIEATDPKYSILSVDGQERLTSSLSVLNLARVDNGTYICETSNSLTQDKDRREAAIIVIEVPEVDNVDATAVSATEVEVTWRVSYDGNALPFMCKVDYRKPGRPDWTLGAFAEEPPLSRRITNLDAYTDYPVRVICRNRAGVGLEVMLPNPIRTLQAAPDAPENVRVTAITSSSLTVEWDAPVIKRGTIAYYVVTVDSAFDEPKSHRTPGPGNPAPLSLVVSELSPYRDYTIFVTAFNVERSNELKGADSQMIAHKTAQSVPSAPVNVLLDNEGDTCIFTWDPPEHENGIIVSYKIFRNAYLFPDAGTENMDEIPDLEKSDFVVTNVTSRSYSVRKVDLTVYTRYRFEVRASTQAGEGAVSTETDLTCDSPRAVPAELQQPMVSDSSENQITDSTFTMKAGPVSQRNGPISCVELTIIRLNDDEVIEGKDPDVLYHPDIHRSYEEAQAAPGLPYIAVVLEG
ncbi:uncharacterized protein LOC119736659 [Patiria miniata]|uniref:Uncharacterized protein n=1 Tax=Patiria miniata TaxID=46514 RepID=A0A914AS54_PATMI|nr:uncharacterized protein LOC119736659 [Patiria miniata]